MTHQHQRRPVSDGRSSLPASLDVQRNLFRSELDAPFTTMSLAINFFRPVWKANLRAEARVINRSKNVGYVECDITDESGKRIAKATSTCSVLRWD